MSNMVIGSGRVGSSARMVTGRERMSEAMASVGVTGTQRMSKLVGRASGSNLRGRKGTFVESPTNLGVDVVTIANHRGSSTVTGGWVAKLPNQGFYFRRPTQWNDRGRGSVLEFKFKANNYFSRGTGSHVAVGVRGNMSGGLNGKGIVLGDVSKYPPHSGVCKPTRLDADITFESFWTGGNCVFGERPNAKRLQNGVIYSVRIIVDDVEKSIQYTIKSEDGTYDRFDKINDPFYDNSSNDVEFFVGTSPTSTTWNMEFGDIYFYNYN